MIQSQAFPINFSQGLDTKTDPKQVQIGKFLKLENSIFEKGGLLQKRNGFGFIADLPAGYITTFNGNLTTIGESISVYSSSLGRSFSKGMTRPVKTNTPLPLIRNNFNQTQADTALANGLVLTVYTQVEDGSPVYLYAIADSVTGQNIVSPTLIPAISGGVIGDSSRCFVVGNFFVIVTPVNVSSTYSLQYFSIPVLNPVTASLPVKLNSEIYSRLSSNPGWDGVVTNDTLVVAYNTTSGGQGVNVTSLNTGQISANATSGTLHSFTGSTNKAELLSTCVDLTASPNIIYISFWNETTTNSYTAAVFIGFGTITSKFTPQETFSALALSNITASAQNGSCLVFGEVVNAYSYDSGVPTHYIEAVTVSSTGTVGTPYVAIRSVGLASKSFIVEGMIYFLSAYESPFQPSYFLINGGDTTDLNPLVVSKLAYENGSGYITLGLPNVTVSGENIAQFPYFFKDLIQALSTTGNTQQTTTGGIYTQAGINLASLEINTLDIDTTEIGNNLNISGGFGWMYDGYLPVEQDFFVWPDNVEVTGSTSGGTMAAQQYFYQVIYSWMDSQGNTFRSAPSIPVTVTTTGSTSSVTVNVPTLRMTYKTADPVKISIYRWSASNEVYYEITSITNPLLNDTTVDQVSFVDTVPDSSIIGNNIIYTTGGVVEDVNPPGYHLTTLADTRQWIVDDEDPNLLWFSKQVIEGTPVEFSDLLTFFVAPTTAAQGSTGPITALAPMDGNLIIFKKNAIYYINVSGGGPDNTGSNSQYSQPIFITSTVGCSNQQSIVFMPGGLMFQSEQGIWLLDRNLQASYIGAPVEAFNKSVVESALNIPSTNQVRFTLDTGQTLMYDYYYSQWGTFVGAPGISSCIYQNLHTFINSEGQVYQETPGAYLDGSNPVLLSFLTGHIQLSGISGFQRIWEIQLLGEYISPHLFNVQIGYDFGPLSESAVIEPTNFTGVFGSDSLYGQTTPYGGPGSLEEWRIQPSTEVCQAFQFSLTEVYDPSFGVVAGEGFTLSAMTCVLGINRGYRPIKATNTTGMSS